MATFVPPTPPADTTIIEAPRGPQNVAIVRAQWLQNFGGGIGAFAIVLALRSLASYVWPVGGWEGWLEVTKVASIVGLLVFGALMLLRAALDEIVQAGDWNQAMQDIEDLLAENEQLKTDLVAAQRATAYAETQLSVMQRKTAARVDRKLDLVDPTPPLSGKWADAKHLIQRQASGAGWGRDALVAAGWTPTRWGDAMDLLQRARLSVKSGRANVLPKDMSYQECLDRFNSYQRASQDTFGRFAASSDEATPEVATRNDEG